MSRKREAKYDYSLSSRRSLDFLRLNFELTDLIVLLNTLPSQRTSKDIETLQKLTRNFNFFRQIISDYEEKTYIECLTYLKYVFFEKNKIVCKAGDNGDYFYIILQGSVKVLVPDEVGRNLTECANLVPGCAFGEFALLKNKPRSATVIATDDCHFAMLCKKDYLRILGIFEKKFDDIAIFLKALPIFSAWGLNTLVRLSYYFHPIHCKRNQKLFKEGAPADFIYIVRKGEMELSKEIIVDFPSKVVIGNFGRPLPSIKKNRSHLEGRMYIIGCGELIGYEEVLNNEVYTQTCKCYSTNAELLQISGVEFKRRIRNEESLNMLAEKTVFRKNHITSTVQMIKEIQSPKASKIHIKSNSDIKLLSDIKALNPWNSSMKTLKTGSISVMNSHRNSLSGLSSQISQLSSARSRDVLKSLWL